MINRRSFLVNASLSALAIGAKVGSSAELFRGHGKIRGIGMCDWNLGELCNPELIPKAKEAHLQGLQVSVGAGPDRMVLRDPKLRQRYVQLAQQHGIILHSVAAGLLNELPLASEPQAAVFVIDALEAAQALGAKNILIAFFGNGDLRLKDKDGRYIEKKSNGFAEYELDKPAVKRVVEALRQIAPRAEKAGVVIGFENTLSAKQNLHIIDQVNAPMLQVYYDVGNSTNYGYDIFSELRFLGNERICEIHLKDYGTALLGQEGARVDMAAVAKVLDEIGYDKWLVLETSGRKNRFMEDTRANVAFVQKTFNMV